MFDEAVARFGARHPLFIGDRLDTDIAGAQAAGIDSVLVLTGIDRPKHVLAAPTVSRPTFIVGDLRELHEPYPETIVKGDVTTVGGASVRCCHWAASSSRPSSSSTAARAAKRPGLHG
ncbi:HAD hydrolase-like protein [Mycolicibacterium celeriflavum]|uniref:HAD hydrolase-like protein n=1 Tax=Mycolicibacterium celeriflavum TaxID=1249101 RepID=UPI003CF9B475